MQHTLPQLPYAYGALEPYLDTMTMEIHHTKHHQAYVNTLNAALEKHPDLQNLSVIELLQKFDSLPADMQTAVRNHGGGHANHSMFWTIMAPNAGGQPQGELADEINKAFGSFDAFQDQFNTAAKTVFGSGWAWLVLDANGKPTIMATANQDSPLLQNMHPIMGLDVWEHAYYLQYQNKRPDYINAWWHVINWEQVHENWHQLVK